MKATGHYFFGLFHSRDPKPKQNNQIASSRAKKRSRLRQTCVKYRGNIICIKRKKDVNTSDKKLHKKRPNKVDFPLSSISTKFYVFFLPPYALLERYGRHGSFGTNIFGSLSFSTVL